MRVLVQRDFILLWANLELSTEAVHLHHRPTLAVNMLTINHMGQHIVLMW
jgi:hypothetical protein